jgi:hypothetical protein
MYPLDTPRHQQSAFVNQLQPMAASSIHGNFGQQLSHPFLQQHQPPLQPASLPQLQFHEGFNPGQFYQHPHHQQYTNDPNSEFDLEPQTPWKKWIHEILVSGGKLPEIGSG